MDRARFGRISVVLALSLVLASFAFTRMPFCPLAGVLGIPCPGCGLTRASLALLQGDVRGAFHFHPLVFVLAPLFAGTVGVAAFGYVRGPRANAKLSVWFTSRLATVLASALLVATLGVWCVRFFGYLGGPAPVTTFAEWARAKP